MGRCWKEGEWVEGGWGFGSEAASLVWLAKGGYINLAN
jgi:hypothetical protein